MASKINSRLKSDKARSGKPYDRPGQSIFRKVASAVRNVIAPSWLLNVSSWGKSSEEETVPAATSVETEVQDEVTEAVCETPIPKSSKRLRYAPDNSEVTDITRPRTGLFFSSSTLNGTLTERVENSTSQAAASCDLEKKEPQLIVNGDDHSENSEGTASTSGCSSLISSHVDKPDHSFSSIKLSENALESLRKELRGKGFSRLKKDAGVSTENSFSSPCNRSASQSDLSLWSRDSSMRNTLRPQPSFQSSRPSFSLTSFGGPSPAANTSISAREKTASPFYEGKTTYGGSSAYRRAQLSSLPYQSSRALRSKITVKPSHSTDDTECMSTAAKRILQTLEKMSTPVTDAKKIPNVQKSPADISASFTPASQRFNSYLPLSRRAPLSAPYSKGPPVSNITSASRLNLLKNFSKISKNSKMEIPVHERSTLSLDHAVESPVPDTEANRGGGGKIRTRINQHLHQSSKANDIQEMPEEVDLPNIPLPITDLPNISFAPKDKPLPSISEENLRSPTPEESVSFRFADPIDNSPPKTIQARDAISTPAFTFSSPLNVKDTTVTSISAKPSVEKPEKSSEEKKKDVELYTGSVDDFLKSLRGSNQKSSGRENSGKESKSTSNTYKADKELLEPVDTGFGDKFKPKLGSWECTSCLVRNDPEADKCAACETNKPGSVDKRKSQAFSFGSMFKPPSGTWECPSCWIRVSENNDKCSACQTPKPGSSAVPVEKVAPQSFSGFGDKFKPAPGSWECSSCLVRNQASDKKCVSCGTENAHATKVSSENLTSGFGDKFKPAPGSWECTSCLVRNQASAKKCVSCESENPHGTKGAIENSAQGLNAPTVEKSKSEQATNKKMSKGLMPADSWECDACSEKNPVSQSKCVACETSRISSKAAGSKSSGFKFEFPSPSSSTPFRFGSLVASPLSTAASSPFNDKSEISKQKDSVQFGSATLPATVSRAFPATSGEGFKFNSITPVTSTGSGGFKFGVPTSVSSKPSEGLFKNETPTSKSSKDLVSNSNSASCFTFGSSNSNQNKAAEHSKTATAETSEVSAQKTEIAIVMQPSISAAEVPTTVHLPKSSTQFSSNTPTSLMCISKMPPVTTSVTNTLTPGGFIFGNASSSQPQCTITFQFSNKTDDIKTTSCAALSAQTTTVFTSNVTSGGISSPSPFIFNSQPNKQFASSETAATTTATTTVATQPNRERMTQDAPVELPSVPEVSSSSTVGFPSSTAPSQPTNFIFGSTNVTAVTSTPFKFTSTVTTSSSATDSTSKMSPMFTFGVPSNTEIKDPKPGFPFGNPVSEEKPQVLPQSQFPFNAFKQDASNPVTTSTSTAPPPVFMFGTSTSGSASTGGFVFGAPKSDVSQAASSPFTFGGGVVAKPVSNSSFGGFSQNQPVTTAAAVPNFTFGMAASNAAPVSGGFSVPNSNPSSLFTFGAKTTQAASNSINNSGPLANPNPIFGNPANQSVFSNTSAIPSFGKPLEQKQETQGGFSFGNSSSQTPVFRFGSTQDGPQEKRHASAPPTAGGFNFNLPQANAMSNSMSFNPTTPPSFNFGGTPPANTTLFQFNACADPSSGQSSGARKIRKAVRRGVRKPD